MREFMTACELAEMLGVSESKAYSYIRQMNSELKEKGFLIARGKINRRYACERFGVVYK